MVLRSPERLQCKKGDFKIAGRGDVFSIPYFKKSRREKAKMRENSWKNAIIHGDVFTKLSMIIFGFGNIVRKQVIKGLLFLSLEISFILFFIMSGAANLRNLVTLGTRKSEQVFDEAKQIYVNSQGDNSMLFLLYGIITVLVVVLFCVIVENECKVSLSGTAAKGTEKTH